MPGGHPRTMKICRLLPSPLTGEGGGEGEVS